MGKSSANKSYVCKQTISTRYNVDDEINPEKKCTCTHCKDSDNKHFLQKSAKIKASQYHFLSSCSNESSNDVENEFFSPIKNRESILQYFNKVDDIVCKKSHIKSFNKDKKILAKKENNWKSFVKKNNKCKFFTNIDGKTAKKNSEMLRMLTTDVDVFDYRNTNIEHASDIHIPEQELAPLFTKLIPPSILDCKNNAVKECSLEEDIFPMFGHTYQLPQINPTNYDGTFYIKTKCDYEFINVEDVNLFWQAIQFNNSYKFSTLIDANVSDYQPADIIYNSYLNILPITDNKKSYLKSLKEQYGKFPTYKCYNFLKKKNVKKKFERETFIGLDTNLNLSTNLENSNSKSNHNIFDGLLFTEKYKAMFSQEILVNSEPVNVLKEFLSLWKCEQIADSAETNLYLEDCTTNITSFTSNSIVLMGPTSSGKTNAVFALANELNFNVLEINAGMQRNGKKINQELHEATQSHLVKQTKIENSKSYIKKKKYDAKIGNLRTEDGHGYDKLSLILVEDADIVFEQDIGFVDALYQIVSNSKRPVILVSTNTSCQHLLKLQKQNFIEFNEPNTINISKYLSILTLIENCPIDFQNIIDLYTYNKKNLRKTLTEIQFYIQSAGDYNPRCKRASNDSGSCVHSNMFEYFSRHYNIWHRIFELSRYTYQLKINAFISINNIYFNYSKKTVLNSDIVQIVRNISTAIDMASCDIMDAVNTSLHEDIALYLVENSQYFINALHFNEKLTLVRQNTKQWSKHSDSTDINPILRYICRTEKYRLSEERRSSRRFYHYLRNISLDQGMPLDIFNTNAYVFTN